MSGSQGRRAIDELIRRLNVAHPPLRVEQLQVLHPGADDDGLCFVAHATSGEEAQIESSTRELPFLIETSHKPPEYLDSADRDPTSGPRTDTSSCVRVTHVHRHPRGREPVRHASGRLTATFQSGTT